MTKETPPEGKVPTGAQGFTPDHAAWGRYGPVVTTSKAVLADLSGGAQAVPHPAVDHVTAHVGNQVYEARGVGDLCDQVAALKAGEVSPQQLLSDALATAREKDEALHAVIALEEERAEAEAAALGALDPADRGSLAGAPYARKDLFYRKGYSAENGSPVFAGQIADTTATVLNRLDAAGGVDIGRLAMAELAMSPTGLNVHTQQPRNPYHLDHVTGGSSSGSGAAVAAGYVRMALGSDTGGSIRHPAAMCGLTGLKPTQDRVSRAGVWPLSWSLDNVGPLARSARDCALVMEVISGPDARDTTVSASAFQCPALDGDLSGKRIAVPREYYSERTTPAIQSALDEALTVFARLGADVIETTVPDMALVNAMVHIVLSVEAAAQLGKTFRDPACPVGRQVRDRLEPGLFYDATEYASALRLRGDIRQSWISAAMGSADAVFLPAIPCEVPTVAETTSDDLDAVAAVLGALTHATRGINYLGLPCLAAPCGADVKGLPIGFQLVGRPCAEAALIHIADAYQQNTKWHSRTPPLMRRA